MITSGWCGMAVQFGVLGPVQVLDDRVSLPIPAAKQRTALAVLLLRVNAVVPMDVLIESLWPDQQPPAPRGALHTHMTRLRRTLGPEAGSRIRTVGAGYIIDVEDQELDSIRFAGLTARGTAALAQDHWDDASDALRSALALWRGEPLADVSVNGWQISEAARLAELRWLAVENWIVAELQAGRYAQVIAELRGLASAHPFRERFHEQLMRALYAVDRRAEALEVYRASQRVLAEELGVEPGPALRELQRAILAGDSARTGPPCGGEAAIPPPERPGQDRLRQLPVAPAHFMGRTGELAALNGLLDRPRLQPGTVVISAIDGMPGVGKTALALHVAHQVADRFPDRQLFADLHGYTPGRPAADPADVLAELLTADGVDIRYLPADLEGRAAMWRDRMAGRKVLLVLDNAASSSQVEPLLPGTATCLVLITSRQFLGDLPPGTAELQLDVLAPPDATEMFTGLAPRAVGAAGQVAELVALCGYLPLAIGLLARLFTRHPAWTLADLISETRTRLLTVSAESRTVAAAFELSYQALDCDQRRFFRYLGLHPGPDVDPYAAAALTGLPLEQAVCYLDALHGGRLLEEPAARRFRMHDLIRHYARGLAEAEDSELRKHAVDQLLDYYQFAARAAGSHVARHALPASAQSGRPATMPALSSWDAARAWMTAERPNLMACIEDAAARGDHARQVGLTAAIAAHVRIDGPWMQGMSCHTEAAAAARQLGDPLGQAGALLSLGDLRRLAGDYPGATEALEQARGIYTGTGNLLGEASVLLCMGEVWRSTGDLPAAASLLEQARAIYADTGCLLGEAGALLVLGTLWQLTCDFPAAADALERSLQISRRAGSRLSEAEALRNLGAVRNLTGDLRAANRALEQALDISVTLSDRSGEANALACLGMVRQGAGDLTGAMSVLEQALATFRGIGSRLGEANALCWLGDAVREAGNLPEAARVLKQALVIYREIGNRHGTASALHNLGSVHQTAGDVLAAEDLLAQARDLYNDVRDALGEAQTLNQIGTLRLERGQPRSARPHHLRALAISRSIANQTEADSALEGIVKCDTAIAAGPDQRR
jgi:DNA-binding SARP family transcriptional activator